MGSRSIANSQIPVSSIGVVAASRGFEAASRSKVIGLDARPGSNLTDMTAMSTELMPKRLELISELVPRAGPIALVVNPNNFTAERDVRDASEAARLKGLQLPI